MIYDSGIYRNAKIDAENKNLFEERVNKFNKILGPRVGDYVYQEDGKLTRFTHDWGSDIQAGGYDGYYLGDGYISYSGSLNKAINKMLLLDINRTMFGTIWFFNRDVWMAHNAVYFKMKFRVYKQIR